MAIGLGVPEHGLGGMTDELARRLIEQRSGEPMRSTSGLAGTFYTTDRERDIRLACRDILAGRRDQ